MRKNLYMYNQITLLYTKVLINYNFKNFKDFLKVCKYVKAVLVVKNPPTNAGDIRDADSIPG